MSLRDEMKIDRSQLNAIQRSLQSIGATKVGTAVFSAVLGPIDQVSHKLSKGRVIIGRKIGGLPVAMLTTTGARSGATRVTPVNVIPADEHVALVASNYGRGRTPGWAHNLRANPQARLNYARNDYSVVASEVEGELYERVFAAAQKVYPGYAGYRRRAANIIPVFILNEAT